MSMLLWSRLHAAMVGFDVCPEVIWLWVAAIIVGLLSLRAAFHSKADKVASAQRDDDVSESLAHTDVSADTMGTERSSSDPLRWAFLGPGARGPFSTSSTDPETSENDLCITKVVAMHRPTLEPWREASGEYPFAWHLYGRKRLFEIRLQLRFKQLPKSRMHFGLTLGGYVPVSGVARQVQKVLVQACKSIVGDFYHSNGDDPERTNGEVEPPTFVMPLWAFDQFVVSDPGEEPDLAGDLEGVGFRRTAGIAQYVREMKSVVDHLSTDKVYTFCFWGISQFLDCMRWEVVGLMPGVRIDFNKLCGAPPVYVAMYEMPNVADEDADKRHLPSRKHFYFNVAMWSEVKPPPRKNLEGLVPLVGDAREEKLPRKKKQAWLLQSAMGALTCCTSRGAASTSSDDAWNAAAQARKVAASALRSTSVGGTSADEAWMGG